MTEAKEVPLFRLVNVEKRYADRQVLRIGELQIYRGEILALVGPSGAGKSTLLRLLNFLDSPSTGTIGFDGISATSVAGMPLAQRRRVTTVFQRPRLLRRSVAANVEYGLRLRGRRKNADAIRTALEAVGLAELAKQPARTLSGGEAQRVALARAIVLQPDALLLDEPTANLDPYNVRLIEEILLDLNRKRGTTVVLVTHNVFQARRLAGRVALLLDGQIEEISDVQTFFERPRSPRTAAFTNGDMIY